MNSKMKMVRKIKGKRWVVLLMRDAGGTTVEGGGNSTERVDKMLLTCAGHKHHPRHL